MSQVQNAMFDPEAFLDVTLSEPTEKREVLPVGEYTGVLGEAKSRAWTGKADSSKSGIALDIPISIDVPADLQASKGLPATLTLKDSIMLDLTENGLVDNSKGKNNRLRMYREAVNMNNAGDVFSPRKLQGQVVTVRVSHEVYNDNLVERVAGVTRA